MPQVPPPVSVLTPVLNEERHLPEVMARMRAQTYRGELEFLLIDGRSDDGSRALLERMAREDPRVRVLDNPARRTPNALNIGLRAARGEYVVRMDAHSHYPPDYIEIGVGRLQRGDVVSVSGPQIAVGRTPWARRVALALSTPLGVGEASFRLDAEEEFEVDTGFTGVWRRETLLRAGGWDEGWPVDQDFELAARLTAAGGRHVCVPAMAAEYIPRDSPKALWRQYWRYGFYRVKTAHRHPSSVRPSHLLPAGLAVTVVLAGLAPSRRLRRAARIGLTVYVATLGRSAARAADSAPAGDAAALLVVFPTMHLAYGAASVWGCVRMGVPVRALATVGRRLAGRARRPAQ